MVICAHGPKFKCIECAPELWNPGSEHAKKVNISILKDKISNLLRWKRAYYRPDDPKVDEKDVVADWLYDKTEDQLKRWLPNHPFFTMVDWDEDRFEECLNWIPTEWQ